MTQEEKTLRQLTEGRENPFHVPDGYFEQFTDRLMQQLPRQERKAKTVSLMPRLWRYAAAVVLIAGVGSVIYWNQSTQPTALANNYDTAQEEYYNEALDYIMVDNMEIAEYLTEANY